MNRIVAEWAMVGLGVASGVLLVVYVLVVSGGPSGPNPLLSVFVALFLVYIAWDVWRHVRGMRTRDDK